MITLLTRLGGRQAEAKRLEMLYWPCCKSNHLTSSKEITSTGQKEQNYSNAGVAKTIASMLGILKSDCPCSQPLTASIRDTSLYRPQIQQVMPLPARNHEINSNF